jgi:hypothetical protein
MGVHSHAPFFVFGRTKQNSSPILPKTTAIGKVLCYNKKYRILPRRGRGSMKSLHPTTNRTASTPSHRDRAKFVRLYPDKFRPAPAVRVVILTRTAHAGFGKAIVKAQRKTKNYFCKVFDQTFFKKFAGVGSAHGLQP